MKRKFIGLTVVLAVIMSVLCVNVWSETWAEINGVPEIVNFSGMDDWNEYGDDYSPYVTMYALDGRTLSVEWENIAAYESVGWYWGEPVTVQALDGRTMIIGKNRVRDYEKVGWYWGEPQTMYGFEKIGRKLQKVSVTVGLNRVLEFEEHGWYWGDVTTIYDSEYEKVADTGTNRVPEYERMGYYWGQPTTMYALDGRTIVVGENRVPDYEAVGWYWGEPVTLQSLDGRTIVVGEMRIKAYENVGWYWGKPVTVYDWKGNPVTIGENRVDEYLEDGYTKEKNTGNNSYGRDMSDACHMCNAGWNDCTFCVGGTYRTYDIYYRTYVTERCTASGCINGRVRCHTCGGDGWK